MRSRRSGLAGDPGVIAAGFLHHYHTSLEGDYHGIRRTCQRIRAKFYWRGLYRSLQRYEGEFMDCVTGKGRPCDRSGSPGNIQATYPFHILATDHIRSLPRSFKRNTELLI